MTLKLKLSSSEPKLEPDDQVPAYSESGCRRADVHRGYRSFSDNSQIIVYIVDVERIDVIGIPHKSMDVGPELF